MNTFPVSTSVRFSSENVLFDIFALTNLGVFANTSASKFPLALLDLIGPCLNQSDERFLLRQATSTEAYDWLIDCHGRNDCLRFKCDGPHNCFFVCEQNNWKSCEKQPTMLQNLVSLLPTYIGREICSTPQVWENKLLLFALSEYFSSSQCLKSGIC